MKQFIDKHAD